jgi:RNA polymerase sigma-70 factor (ECF subfamily)
VSEAADKLNLDLLRRRDAAEFTRFVRMHERLVLGLCQSLGLTPADREDAAAETFAIAYRGLATFRGEAELSTWLYRIACRTALKVRRRYREGAVSGAAETLPEREDPQAASPVADAALRETYAGVWAAVEKLDPEQAAAVELFYRRGMSVEEVAGVLEKPAGTVKTLLFRARERLRYLLRAMENKV